MIEAVCNHPGAELCIFRSFAREKLIDRLAENFQPTLKMLRFERKYFIYFLVNQKRISEIDGFSEKNLFPKINNNRQMRNQIEFGKMMSDLFILRCHFIKPGQKKFQIFARFDVSHKTKSTEMNRIFLHPCPSSLSLLIIPIRLKFLLRRAARHSRYARTKTRI